MRPIFTDFSIVAGLALVFTLLFLFSDVFARKAPKSANSPLPTKTGKASWYGEGYRGRRMANGELFDPDALTCATFAYPLGTWLVVRSGSKSTLVQVTDRGPDPKLNRLIDLSRAAFARLAAPERGVISVTVWRAVEVQP